MRVKSRKPPAEYLMTSERVTSSKIACSAYYSEGDKVWDVAGHGEHEIVMLCDP